MEIKKIKKSFIKSNQGKMVNYQFIKILILGQIIQL